MVRGMSFWVGFAALVALPAVSMAQQSQEATQQEGASQSDSELEETERRLERRLDGRSSLEEGAELASLSTGLHPAVSGSAMAERRKLKKIREKLAKEPSIEEVQEAALEFYDLDEGQIDRYSAQASSKSLAPKLSVQYRRNMIDTNIIKKDFINYGDRRAGLDRVDGDVDEVTVSGTWNLPKLIYNPEKLELASLRKMRERVLKEVTRLYYLRRRLKITFMLDPPQDASTRARKQIRIKQATAMINALTDGIFKESDG